MFSVWHPFQPSQCHWQVAELKSELSPGPGHLLLQGLLGNTKAAEILWFCHWNSQSVNQLLQENGPRTSYYPTVTRGPHGRLRRGAPERAAVDVVVLQVHTGLIFVTHVASSDQSSALLRLSLLLLLEGWPLARWQGASTRQARDPECPGSGCAAQGACDSVAMRR